MQDEGQPAPDAPEDYAMLEEVDGIDFNPATRDGTMVGEETDDGAMVAFPPELENASENLPDTSGRRQFQRIVGEIQISAGTIGERIMTFDIRRLVLSAFFITVYLQTSPSWSQVSNEINQANGFYQTNQYPKAAEIYENLLAHGIENGHLHYNLGNTYIRMGKTGKAILSYLKAKPFLPRNEDLQANLNYAIYETTDKLDWERSDSDHNLFFWIDEFTLEEYLMILLAVNIAFWLTMGVWVTQRTRFMDVTRKILLGALILTLASTGFCWHHQAHWDYGVVLQEIIQVHSEVGADRVVLFELHEGAVVKIREEKSQSYRIALPDGETGWALIADIGT